MKRQSKTNMPARPIAKRPAHDATRVRRIIRECRHCLSEIHRLLIELLVVAGIIGSLWWLLHHELLAGLS